MIHISLIQAISGIWYKRQVHMHDNIVSFEYPLFWSHGLISDFVTWPDIAFIRVLTPCISVDLIGLVLSKKYTLDYSSEGKKHIYPWIFLACNTIPLIILAPCIIKTLLVILGAKTMKNKPLINPGLWKRYPWLFRDHERLHLGIYPIYLSSEQPPSEV